MTQEKIKTVCVDKLAYEAVLRNSIKVNDLEAKNQQLKELLKECRETFEGITEHTDYNEVGTEKLLTKIDNAIGEKQPSFKDYITEDQLKQLKGGKK